MAGSRSELVKRFEVRSPLEPAGKMSRDASSWSPYGRPAGEPRGFADPPRPPSRPTGF